MRLVFLGPPGAGKGTQARALAREWGVAHVATGDMLREALAAGTRLGLEAKRYMDRGALVPDDVIIGLMRERLAGPDAARGFIVDGFPRTIAQAEALAGLLKDAGQALDRVIYFEVSERRPGRSDDHSQVRARDRADARGGAHLGRRHGAAPRLGPARRVHARGGRGGRGVHPPTRRPPRLQGLSRVPSDRVRLDQRGGRPRHPLTASAGRCTRSPRSRTSAPRGGARSSDPGWCSRSSRWSRWEAGRSGSSTTDGRRSPRTGASRPTSSTRSR